MKAISFRETDKGANVWLVVPKDEGVFYGQSVESEVPVASAVQVYLDLGGHPERADDAKAAPVSRRLAWMQ